MLIEQREDNKHIYMISKANLQLIHGGPWSAIASCRMQYYWI